MSRPDWGSVVHHGVIAIGGAFLAVLAISAFAEPARVGSTGGASGVPASPAPSRLDVATQDFQFAPTTLRVAPGAGVTLTVTNTGAVAHSFTSDSPSVSVDVAAGQSRSVTFTAPGSAGMAFYCRFHPRMQGTITVGATPGG